MPSSEIVNAMNIPSPTSNENSVASPLSGESSQLKSTSTKKVPVEHYIKSFVLLIAVYSLIINRATDDKKNQRQGEPKLSTPIENLNAYTSHSPKNKKQNHLSLFYYSGTPIVFYPNYLLIK